MRNGVTRVANEGVDDLLGVVTCGPRIPQAQGSQAIGVNVLRCPFEFGEWGNGAAAVSGLRMVDLEQQRLVALHDQGAVGHALTPQ